MTDREFDLLLRSALLELNRKELEEAAHLNPIEPSPRYLRWRMKFLADPFRYGEEAHPAPMAEGPARRAVRRAGDRAHLRRGAGCLSSRASMGRPVV